MSSIAEWASVLSAAASLVAITFGLGQIRQMKQARVASVRPYVSVRYDCDTSGAKSRVFLEFRNHGRTPATNLKLNVEGPSKWHNVLRPDYPFTSGEGIPNIQPGESIRYFVGELGSSKDFDLIKSKVVTGTISYFSEVSSQTVVEKAQLTLSHLRYSKSLTPQGAKTRSPRRDSQNSIPE